MDKEEAGNDEAAVEEQAETEQKDPVRKWTFIVLGVSLLLIAWYLASDRHTPFTSQARVHTLVVPVGSEVSGTVVEVFVENNQLVKAGDKLFQVDPSRYQFALDTAVANLESARQATGASEANVVAAEAGVAASVAGMVRAEKDYIRLKRIQEEDPGAISTRRVEQAEASFEVAKQQVASAQANLRKAQEDFGEAGEQNVRILQAQAAVDAAQLDLARTTVLAQTDGLVTDLRVDIGNFAGAGAPQLTFIAVHNVWVQADFTENNLGNIVPGNEVEIVFDAFPGSVFDGTIRSTGFGVAVSSAPLGQLPTIDNNRQWLRSAQRFPVIVDFDTSMVDAQNLIRVGSQASVVVYTSDSWILNSIAWINMRINALLSYAY